jgi:ATP-dependent DNA helicase RecQ
VCETLLAGRSALAIFPTGGGKSLCYQLPALLLDGLTLVVSPLIALMKDQVDFLRARDVPAARLDSSLDAAAVAGILDDLAAGRLKILYVAPERFLNERFLERIGRTRVALLAIDEAHCISQWGHNFRPDYLKLAEHARRPARRARAGADGDGHAARRRRHRPGLRHRERRPRARPASTANLEPVVPPSRAPDATRRCSPPASPVRRSCTSRCSAPPSGSPGCSRRGHRRARLPRRHGGRRACAIQDWFMADRDEDRVVVATIAFGMGIDKSEHPRRLPLQPAQGARELLAGDRRAGRGRSPARLPDLRLPRRPAGARRTSSTATRRRGRRSPASSARSRPTDSDELVEVSYRALSDAHDMRELVVKTLVTYLELDGLLRQTTPIYAEYKWKLLAPRDDILARFDGERRPSSSRSSTAPPSGRCGRGSTSARRPRRWSSRASA